MVCIQSIPSSRSAHRQSAARLCAPALHNGAPPARRGWGARTARGPGRRRRRIPGGPGANCRRAGRPAAGWPPGRAAPPPGLPPASPPPLQGGPGPQAWTRRAPNQSAPLAAVTEWEGKFQTSGGLGWHCGRLHPQDTRDAWYLCSHGHPCVWQTRAVGGENSRPPGSPLAQATAAAAAAAAGARRQALEWTAA